MRSSATAVEVSKHRIASSFSYWRTASTAELVSGFDRLSALETELWNMHGCLCLGTRFFLNDFLDGSTTGPTEFGFRHQRFPALKAEFVSLLNLRQRLHSVFDV